MTFLPTHLIGRSPRAAVFALSVSVLAATLGAPPALTFDTTAREALLVDFETGAVLLEKNADQPTPPASMSKLMTMYMLFERLKEGLISLDDSMLVSEKAWRMGGSKMFVEVGDSVRVEDLIRGIVVQSGNDACIVVAEALAGSEEAFGEDMTQRGRELGLRDSNFTNSTGWPDPGHFMTPRDLALLTRRLIEDFPEYFHYFAETSFTYSEIKQGNRNPLLYQNIGADGMKTGYTRDSGYGLTATAVRDGRRLILVVTGYDSARKRAEEAVRILAWGFRESKNYTLFKAGETIETADVWLGSMPRVPLIVEDDLTLTLTRAARRDLTAKVVLTSPVPAPITRGAEIATLILAAPDIDTIEIPLRASTDVARLGYFGRLWSAMNYMLFGAGAS